MRSNITGPLLTAIRMPLRILAFSAAAVMSLTVCGCTVVQVSGPAQTAVSYHAGTVRIEPGDARGTLVVKTTGIGVIPLQDGVAIGLAKEERVVIADNAPCKVVLVIRNQPDLEKAKELLETISAGKNICTVD
ncbi:hypothetical protein [Ralstonia flatus]|uniref:hypothetical protein n=1 Tax=Ralstonia flatus TaxID=3058601 RepID=UPI00292CFB76|nr:hypothetical protein [Ralstonia sp. LMG 32965]